MTLTDATAGATIYYTTDGTIPSSKDNRYTAPIKVSASMTIKAVAELSGYAASDQATGAYTIQTTK